MMRVLPIAASFALALMPLVLSAQDGASTSAPQPVAATTTVPVAATTVGDAAKGRQLIYTCMGCHGVEGYQNAYPNFHVPKIGGQTEPYLVAALMAYKKGERKHATMQAQAESFSEQDIADIAAFLSSVK